MSETNGAVISLRRGVIEIDDQRKFRALLYDLHDALNELREETEQKEGQPEIPYREFKDRFIKVIEAKYVYCDSGPFSGMPVQLTRGEADYLIDQIDVLYAKKKTAFADEWRSAAKLRNSTESTQPA